MVSIVIVDKQGCLKNVKVKDVTTQSLAKKCNFKNADDFAEMCIWDMSDRDIKIHLFAKLFGRANCENKYDFPPPVDNVLYFGCCVLIAHNGTNEWTDLQENEWEQIYEDLFGGFENLEASAKDDEMEEDELEHIPDELKTKSGYLKDDFVVDDNEGVCSSNNDCDDDEESWQDTTSELDYEEYTYSDED